MRHSRFSPADIDAAVRALLLVPRTYRKRTIEHILSSAVLASELVEADAKAHAVLGSGSISSVLSKWPKADVHSIDMMTQGEALCLIGEAMTRLCKEA